MATRQKPNDLKATTPVIEDLPEPDVIDDPDVAFVENGEEEESNEPVHVRTGVDKVIVNGHVLAEGTVIKMAPKDVVHHRNHGVALHDVADDYAGEVYDVSEPYVSQEVE